MKSWKSWRSRAPLIVAALLCCVQPSDLGAALWHTGTPPRHPGTSALWHFGSQALWHSGPSGRWEFTEVHMGLPVRIVLHASNEATARAAARAAFTRIVTLDHMMSDYRSDSELRRLDERPQAWIVVSPELFDVLFRAVEIAQETDDAFDPTVGPLVALWRQARRSGSMPDRQAIDAARSRVGWRFMELDVHRRAVRLSIAGMRLDLGGIAKGYILQDALGSLRAQGVKQALVEAGGDIVVGDAPPGRRGWAIDTPATDPAFSSRAAALTNAALSTSGPTAQFVAIDGIRYSHVIDPRTGVGVTNGFVASVIGEDAATADALSTALSVVGPDGARTMLARFPGVMASVHR